MSSLFPARRIPQWMVVIGSVFVILSLAIGVGHFGFGAPVYNGNTGNPSSDVTIALLLAAFASVGLLLVWLGRVILRAAAGDKMTKSRLENVR